ncbi:hypothetical protein KKH65_01910, partial [bacterium]|nr:hypothetical protein [bacterium]
MQAVLTPELKIEIRELINEHIREKHIPKEDFTELKNIVKEIANEQREIAKEQRELVEAQKEAQKEIRILVLTMKDTKIELKGELKDTRSDLGGVTSTLGFML